MIKFSDVCKSYSDNQNTLENINIGINQGEFVFLLGKSGAGKSTFLKLLTREEKISSGRLTILGTDVSKIKQNKVHLYRRNFGIVFQDFILLKEKTVYENIEIAMRAVGANPKDIKPRIFEVLKKVGLASKFKNYPHELSGGECQRVAIARAIVNKPSILIADECTGNLDSLNSMRILNILKDINKEGVTVIMATHDMEIVNKFPYRIIEIEGKTIVRDTKRDYYESDYI